MLIHHLKRPKSALFSNLPFSQTPRCFPPESNPIWRFFSLNPLSQHLFESRKYLQSLFLFKKASFSRFVSQQDPLVFPSLLRSCACLSLLDFGVGLHGHLTKLGLLNWVDINGDLMRLYVKLGYMNAAHQVFDEMPMKSNELCNSAIFCFGSGGFFASVLDVFELMLDSGLLPSPHSVRFAIMACGELRRLDKAMQVHDFVTKSKFDCDLIIGNLLISMYVRVGRMDLASCVFKSMSNKDVVTWNSIINGYAQSKNWVETFRIFQLMKEFGNVTPNMVTFLGLVLACGDAENLDQGKSLHGHCFKTALMSESRLGTAIVNMYAKCNCIELAEAVFQESLFLKSLVSWNSLIFGYSQNGYYEKAVKLFKGMISSDFKPDSVTFSNALHAYSDLGSLKAVKSVHGLVIKKGFDMEDDFVLGTSMVDAYGKCSDSNSALFLFESIQNPNVATWNALLGAFVLDHEAELGMLHFHKMCQTKISPDAVTILAVLQSCAELGSMKQATMAHCYSLSRGFSSNLDVENATLDMYIRCGSAENAQTMFTSMPLRNVVSWNTMISGFPQCGITLFSQMLLENNHRPNAVTLLTLIQASATIWSGHGVGTVHSFALKLGVGSDTPVMNSLIDLYAKTGMIENGRLLFHQMDKFRDQCSWNIMIAGYGMNGQGTKACELFDQMEEEPDSITFISLLSACSHSGLIDEGCRYFDLMVNKYKIEPGHEHWTCIIDLFGRAGRLEDAYRLVTNGLQRSLKADAIWGALLDGCRMNMNLKVGELAREKLLEIAPQNCGYYTLVSNFYAANDKWDEVDKVRSVFDDRVTKKPGLSLVQT